MGGFLFAKTTQAEATPQTNRPTTIEAPRPKGMGASPTAQGRWGKGTDHHSLLRYEPRKSKNPLPNREVLEKPRKIESNWTGSQKRNFKRNHKKLINQIKQ